MKKVASMKDIAKKLGVSIALVSYVLNGKEKQGRVGKEMADKIRRTAKELNYQPNQIARSLKTGKTNILGVILADIANPFFSQIARIIEDEAKKFNYTVIFGSSDEDSDKSLNLMNTLLNRQVDGFIISPSEKSEDQVLFLKENKIPFVLIDRYFPDIKTNYIAIDNYEVSYKAITHLIKTGHRRVGMIAYKTDLFHMEERKRGYLNALKVKNLVSDYELLREADFRKVKIDVEEGIDELLSLPDPPDALFFATITLAIHGLKYIDERNIRVPRDLGVVSFDQGDAFDFYYCPLTYINQPIMDLAREAVLLLLDVINHKSDHFKEVKLNSELIIRSSSLATS